MIEPQDDRVALPPAVKSIIITVLGTSGVYYFINGTTPIFFSDSIWLLINGVNGGLSTYGIVSLIGNIRQGQSISGIKKEIRNTFRKLYD